MKSFVYVCVAVLLYWNCTNGSTNAGGGANASPSAGVMDAPPNQSQQYLKPENRTVNCGPYVETGCLRIDSYVDDQLESSDFFQNQRIFKRIAYNTQTKISDAELRYFYTEDGSLARVELKGADGATKEDTDLKRRKEDLALQLTILNSKYIDFPFADIVGTEVRDLASILSAAESYGRFNVANVGEKRRVIKLTGFNKTGRFYNSIFASLIGDGDFIRIKDYELRLESTFPTKESLTTDTGALTREYSYKDGNLIGVVYKFTDLENKTNSLTKRFEYHELNQKP